MTFQDFLVQLQAIKIEESRAQTEEYFEAVIATDSLAPLHQILTSYFGPALKPEGCSPSGEANRLAKPYGGIRKDQTMYFRRDEEHCEYAFLWPWGSGTRITLKIVQSKSSGVGGDWTGFLQKLFIPKA